MHDRSTPRRSFIGISALLVGGLALASAVTGPARAALPPGQDTSAFCVNVPDGYGGFTDTGSSIHRRTISCLAFAGVTKGTSPTQFSPDGEINRGQMASFVARAIDIANQLELIDLADLPVAAGDHFADDNGSVHEVAINRLAEAGIVRGATLDRFAPDANVTRAQMASFINNAQRFLTHGQAPFGSQEDYFRDDNGNLHEDNINGIAAVGITQGLNRADYAPDDTVRRANMATFISRYLAVLHHYDAISPVEAEPDEPDPTTNATIPFRPTGAFRTTAGDGGLVFTASGLSPTTRYRVTLVEASKVSLDDGVFTFAARGGAADEGASSGLIHQVDGLDVAPARSVGGLTPTGGSITVRVAAERTGQIYPVIHPEGQLDGLAIDADGEPIDAFGVAALVTTLPAAAESGNLGTAAEILLVDKEEDIIAARVGGTERTFVYDSNDRFFASDDPDTALSLAAFEARLTRGDVLDATTRYEADRIGVSDFVLDNVSPAPPEASVTSAAERSAVITITNLVPGATANVFLGPDGTSFAGAVPTTSTDIDADEALAGFQVEIDGLSPGTSYEYYVTQSIDGEESQPRYVNPGPETSLSTGVPAAPSVTGATVDGGRPGKVVHIDFSEAVSAQPGAAGKVRVTCSLLGLPLPTFDAAGVSTAAVDADTQAVTFASNIPGGPLDQCQVTVGAGAFADGGGATNAVATRNLS